MVVVFFFFFFFKQKTAYEIYQCDWSSDVCSSDLTIVASGIVPSAVELREVADSVVMDSRRPSRFREPDRKSVV